VYNHCNICNIPIYFCNIRMKRLKHTYETLETCACNMREPEAGDSSRWGQSRRRTSTTTTTTIASSTGLSSAGQAARTTARERAARDGQTRQAGMSGVGLARDSSEAKWAHDVRMGRPRLEKAATLEKASGRRVARWMRPQRSHACGSGEKCRFYFS
jgi:hypothetical protein